MSGREREAGRAAYERLQAFVNPNLARVLKFSSMDKAEERGEGMRVFDAAGGSYLDFCGGYGVYNLGHNHPAVVAAVKAQLDLMPLSSKVFIGARMTELAERLAAVAPGELKYTFFCNSGTEAVEAAFKLARLATGRSRVVYASGAFHGKTMGSLSLSGRPLYREPFEPLVPETRMVPYGDAAALAEAMDAGTAAVILEPIQGEGGIIVPPDGYLGEARRLCDAAGALLILDEVQTGMGRTGKLFAGEHEGVVPDLMCLAKALGGGVMPIGACMGTPEVWKALAPMPLVHTSTFGGGGLACAAGLATLDVLEKEGLAARAEKMGAYLMRGLERLAEEHPRVIAAVRGRGLMVGVELGREGYGGAVIPAMVKRGVIVAYTLNNQKVIRFEPPLIVGEEEIDECMEAFHAALAEAAKLDGGND